MRTSDSHPVNEYLNEPIMYIIRCERSEFKLIYVVEKENGSRVWEVECFIFIFIFSDVPFMFQRSKMDS